MASPSENVAIAKIEIFVNGKPSGSVCQDCSSVSSPADAALDYDLSSLLEMLEQVPDPWKARGKDV
jgi:hypothetical protein